MKIALLGYGKMGKIIEKIALERGHEVVLRKDKDQSFDGLLLADVAIDFSAPTAAVENISEALSNKIPVVSGTTGWLEDYHQMVELCQKHETAFLYGSNFSLGVNIFFEINDFLARIMANFPDYKVEMEEIHHTQKLDAPSGTAISLANAIINHTNYDEWSLISSDEKTVKITAKREDDVPGTHTVTYNSAIDAIEIKHTAHNREGFALGAVLAAEWIKEKKGVFSMKDVLKLN
jgi:4-hydroxy-tetrahydrodipicolinate reductase